MRTAMIIALGGAIGSLSRYGAQTYIYKLYPFVFPLGTFLVNMTGCLIIGLAYGLSEKGDLLTPEWRLFLTTGFCGGFTTFSTFAYENASLIRSSDFLYLGLNILGSVAIGIAAVFLGILIVKVL
ncbi:MAG: camphor resistance protein CrcB [Sphingobacteriales bacterium 50-39]|nr:fluoride efflux transporter CrcB [Sphingobacteriales bacterium]OJW56376.1 MAG: camphor resistance protein CrcB [Sphingobacteriales bacterium 50-39]